MSKKRELMNQAVHFFSLKGFHQTSVNEIAQASGISKGAFYKHFDSKESLFIEILKQYQKEIIAETSALRFPEAMSRSEVFSRKLTFEIERTLADREFFVMVFKDFPPGENDQIACLFQELRYSTMAFHKKSLLEAYGAQIEPFLPDLITVLEGMLREYFITLIFENKHVSASKIGDFVAASMDAIISQLGNMTPVLTGESSVFDEQEELLHTLEAKIQKAVLDKERLLPSLHLLKEELNKKEPQRFLIEALLVYLKQEKQLEQEINRLETFITL
ncbi:TetR/AcrR family transcriptional regulator [Planococcus sp. YIM B11945]|uniref:TetR/AcrR family transcriptional regulator n=1 Tax=Planococcus sp. YIM B11945 TaxID=3435410 RepID=UPI003D7DA27D